MFIIAHAQFTERSEEAMVNKTAEIATSKLMETGLPYGNTNDGSFH